MAQPDHRGDAGCRVWTGGFAFEEPALRGAFAVSRNGQPLQGQQGPMSKHQKTKYMINTGPTFSVLLGLETLRRHPVTSVQSILSLLPSGKESYAQTPLMARWGDVSEPL